MALEGLAVKGICRQTECAELGEHNRDWSMGGCGDFLFVCDEHAEVEDLKHDIRSLEATRNYHLSIIRSENKRIADEIDQVATLNDKIMKASCRLAGLS